MSSVAKSKPKRKKQKTYDIEEIVRQAFFVNTKTGTLAYYALVKWVEDPSTLTWEPVRGIQHTSPYQKFSKTFKKVILNCYRSKK
jgi:hypothetical protein